MGRRHTRSDELHAAQAERFAALLADLLYQVGLTHKEVAQMLGVPVGTVDSWTRGSDPKIPSETNLSALCVMLNEHKPGAGVELASAAGRSWSPPNPAPNSAIETGHEVPTEPLAADVTTTSLEARAASDTVNLSPIQSAVVRAKQEGKTFLAPAALVMVLLALLAGGAILMQSRNSSPGGDPTTTPSVNPTPPSEGVQLGDRLLAERKPDQALSAYELVLASESSNAQALLGKGRALTDLERYGEAVGALTDALAAKPGDFQTLLARAHVYLRMKYWGYARDDANRALELDEASLDALLARGHAAAGSNAWAEALADYDAALKTHSNDPSVYLDRGEAYLEHGDAAQATADFNKALSLNPGPSRALVALGRTYLTGDLIQPNRALEYFSQAIEAEPDSSDAYYWRGYTYMDQIGVPASARDDLTKAIDIGPANSRLYHARAKSEELLDDREAQLADLDRAVALDPRNPQVYHWRYEYSYWNRDYTHALSDLNTELGSDRNNPLLHIYRSELYLLLENPVQAEVDARQAVVLGHEYALTYVALAQALSIQQKYTDALAEANRAVRASDPDNHVAALAARGWVELKMGQISQATADFEEALKSDGFNRIALFGRASISIDNNQFESALNDIELGINQYDRYGLGYLLRARVAMAQDKPDKARADLSEAQDRILYPDESSQVKALLGELNP